jgi:hypothetical protein
MLKYNIAYRILYHIGSDMVAHIPGRLNRCRGTQPAHTLPAAIWDRTSTAKTHCCGVSIPIPSFIVTFPKGQGTRIKDHTLQQPGVHVASTPWLPFAIMPRTASWQHAVPYGGFNSVVVKTYQPQVVIHGSRTIPYNSLAYMWRRRRGCLLV